MSIPMLITLHEAVPGKSSATGTLGFDMPEQVTGQSINACDAIAPS